MQITLSSKQAVSQTPKKWPDHENRAIDANIVALPWRTDVHEECPTRQAKRERNAPIPPFYARVTNGAQGMAFLPWGWKRPGRAFSALGDMVSFYRVSTFMF